MWLEQWTHTGAVTLKHSLKINDICSKIYQDSAFGFLSWANDCSKVVFIGEVPEPAAYKNPWADEKKEEDKKEEAKDASAAEEKKKQPEVWNTDKFVFKEEFGEQMLGKKTPGIFVYNLLTNELKRIASGLEVGQYAQFPVFDERSTGLVFTAVDMPIKKLGIVYCLNRPTGLYYIKDPKPFEPATPGKDETSDEG
jgi:hypothetical protein